MAHQQPCAPSLRGFAPGTRQITTVLMPTQRDLIRRDVDLLAQQYRIVLVSFTCLDAEYERLQGSNELRECTAAALPRVQTALREALGDVWCQPQLSAAAVRVVSTMSEALTNYLGELAEGMLQRIIGETPPALQLAHYLTPQTVIGILPIAPPQRIRRIPRILLGSSGRLVSI